MTRQSRRRNRSLLLYWVAVVTISVFAQGGVSGENFVFDALACAIGVIALGNVHWHLMPRLRRAPLLAVFVIAAILYVAVVVASICLAICILVFLVTRSVGEVGRLVAKFFAEKGGSVQYPIEIAICLSFVGELGRRIGGRRLWDLVRGRYRNPREENRVLLFIDLRGSTPLAESLGAIRFSFLLRDIFDDLTEPVLESEGDVASYVGDEAIVTWPFERGIADGNAIRCFQAFKARIAARAGIYEREYGMVPRFRAAIHAGPIVATEVGQIRTDVALHGDALNTTARVMGECSALDAELLVTEAVSSRLGAIAGVTLEPLGRFELRGKEELVGLSRVLWK